MSVNRNLWLTRLLVGLVTAWNLQAALVFILTPQVFAPAYELSGEAGQAAIRGMGILFLMWNVPYLFALWHPDRYRLALVFAILMQFVGLIGETYIFYTISVGHLVLRTSILRFMAFDGVGLIFLLLAYLLLKKS